MPNQKVLIVIAHPDDEILGCGGSMAVHASKGDKVSVIAVADGVTSRMYIPGKASQSLSASQKAAIIRRNKEMIKASKILEVPKQNITMLNMPDQRLDAMPILDIIKRIEKRIALLSPDIVYTHHWSDLNKDHRIVFEAVLTALRPSRKSAKKTLIRCCEISGNMDILPPKAANMFTPNVFIDISGALELKINALKAYKSELAEYPRPTSKESVIELAKMRGRKSNYKYAEAFEEIKV